MSTTLPADFAFSPKVWSDHVMAYFDKKLQFGAMALMDRTLTEAPGTTKNFPYWTAIGAAQKPSATEALEVDKMADNSFACTVLEGGKAVGIRKAALMSSAASREANFAEAQRQIGRVLAEQVDGDLITEVNTSGSYIQGFTSADSTGLMTIRRILEAKVVGFGDKQADAVAIFMHSQHFLDLMTDSTAGFLKADANDPFWGRPGFEGRLLGMALFINDNVPEHTNINSKRAFEAFIMKPNPYGICLKEEVMMDVDYDILNREYVFAGTQWYGVKSLHSKVASNDYRVARMSVVTQLAP